MNRLVLIGNGFDLAHGLKTSYKDFIYWYWKNKIIGSIHSSGKTIDDGLCAITVLKEDKWSVVWLYYSEFFKERTGEELYTLLSHAKDEFRIDFTPFFENIHKSIETKGWVDIENEYYKLLEQHTLGEYSEEKVAQLNEQLESLQIRLTKYLMEVNNQDIVKNKRIQDKIYSPIAQQDISVEATPIKDEYLNDCEAKDNQYWEKLLNDYDIINTRQYSFLHEVVDHKKDPQTFPDIPQAYRLPERIMLLNFNYTKTVDTYLKSADIFTQIHIHGSLHNPYGMIFGYGDEFDDKYKKIQDLNNNECLANMKTIKYLESDNYRKVLQFIDSAPFQVCIMGHSCGNSDRTLLNTIFEHKNCISIKPYYYMKDDGTDSYIEIIQNISRNFKDMKLMRDRVVNKLYCEKLTGE